jgi:sRNA-binding regulator protein Hfq
LEKQSCGLFRAVETEQHWRSYLHQRLEITVIDATQTFALRGDDLTEAQKDRQEAAAFNGTRKLVRPHLPVQERRRGSDYVTHIDDPLSHAMTDAHAVAESSHAEAFYFQKQMQMQTEMMLVLDDGEELRGVIEWYDKCVVKLRVGRQRVMVYKSGIKYLFKASEAQQQVSVMK